MPIQGTVTLNTVPYSPGQPIATGVATWYDRSNGSIASPGTFTENVRDNGNGKQLRSEFKLRMPTVAAESSTYAAAGDVTRESYTTIVNQIAKTSTPVERNDYLLRLRALVNSSVFEAAVVDGEGSW